jgi:tetratricopeptide (TPR) repeat protein
LGVRRAALFLVVLVVTACAPRAAVTTAPAAPAAPPPALATLIDVGCYRCLEDAFARTVARGPSPAADRDLFQLAILLTLRAKELGLPYQPWLDRAETHMPLGDEWALYLEIAKVVRVDPLSGDREEILSLTSSQRRPVATVLEWISTLRSGVADPLFRAYLDLTVSCSAGQRQEAIERAEATFGEVPLIQYRIGTCGSPAHLARVRDERAEYVDADLPLGRNALETATPDQEEALRRFAAARAAFPESPLISTTIGDLRREREEWAEALEAYDATLTLVATHRDALMGRTIALSNLSRHDEAIATADRILSLGNWFEGGAYFWRAWNYYNLGSIDAARRDVDQARARGRSPATLVLAGMIAWRQNELAPAEQDFQSALDIDRGQCEAAALQGGVRAARARLAEALESFQHAIQCFDLTIALRRKFIEDIEQGPGTREGKAGQKARHERAIAEAEKNRGDAVQSVATLRKRLAPNSR